MRYIVIHKSEVADETHEKWVPSIDYQFCAEDLLVLIEESPGRIETLGIPFILTLCASLEATLSDYLIRDTFAKHGAEHYKILADAYTRAPFRKKLRIAVAVLTDNTFQLREDAPAIQQLNELIKVRNKIAHPQAYYELSTDGIRPHPARTLTAEDCRRYNEAVIEYKKEFLYQYDEGYIVENDLIVELEKIGKQIEEKPDE